ncbi:MAG TPA: pirin family protein, partial [Acidimicrobiales bacterium]|nr:pirin family protein [Acidimicrobiales bacterium]
MEPEVATSRTAEVGRFSVRRALPRRGRRTVGAWCFVDHMGPATVTPGSGLDVGPHPHCGLQTVTWLIEGEALHHDSLGTEQLLAPGQLNLMTAGGGVAHSEEATGSYAGDLEGVQLWVALPEATRHGAARFEHVARCPRADLRGGVATVLVGSMLGEVSPAAVDSALLGADLEVSVPVEVPLDPAFEHVVVALRGTLRVAAAPVAPGQSAYLSPGAESVRLEPDGPARALLLGGEPFTEPILMWWNFVARTRAEMEAARADWAADSERFGTVASSLARIDAPDLFWRPGALVGADPS